MCLSPWNALTVLPLGGRTSIRRGCTFPSLGYSAAPEAVAPGNAGAALPVAAVNDADAVLSPGLHGNEEEFCASACVVCPSILLNIMLVADVWVEAAVPGGRSGLPCFLLVTFSNAS